MPNTKQILVLIQNVLRSICILPIYEYSYSSSRSTWYTAGKREDTTLLHMYEYEQKQYHLCHSTHCYVSPHRLWKNEVHTSNRTKYKYKTSWRGERRQLSEKNNKARVGASITALVLYCSAAAVRACVRARVFAPVFSSVRTTAVSMPVYSSSVRYDVPASSAGLTTGETSQARVVFFFHVPIVC